MFRSLLVALAALVATPALAEPAMWTVRDADSEIVLFGSMHVLPKDLDWKPPALDAALAKADDLWFELPMDAAADVRMQALSGQYGLLPPGQTLTSRLKPRAAARLRKLADRLSVPMSELERLRPWMAEVRLTTAAFAQDRGLAEDGVERRLQAAAPPSAARRAFETPDQQMALFAGASEADQIKTLNATIRQLEKDPGAYRRLVAAWSKGDQKALERAVVGGMRKSSPALYRRFIVERNARWMDALQARLAGSGRTVVVVGAGHLLGPDGLPARLRALGYDVEGPR
ncbi:MAG: TraB/GumN family protein [Caulobacter sp.]